MRPLILLLLALIALPLPGGAQNNDDTVVGETRGDDGQGATTEPPVGPRALGWEDADGDGRNDRFRDADGDGVNDVDGRPYAHRFPEVDEDGDGVNDRFRDADGDGVNDLDGAVVDADEDGFNDITGRPVVAGQPAGWRFGRIDESVGVEAETFRDLDGDGMHDAWMRPGTGPAETGRPRPMPMDVFIDEDGDGIADGRAVRGGPGLLGEPMRLPGPGRMGPMGPPGDPPTGRDAEDPPRRDDRGPHHRDDEDRRGGRR